MKTTLFKNITQVTGGVNVAIDKVLKGIKSGKWSDKINDLRNELAINGKTPEYKALKKALPYFTVSGTFEKRNDNGLIDHSGLIAVDIDNIPDMPKTRDIVKKDKYTFALFTSCSGNGLCAIVKINPENHYQAFDNLEIYYRETLNIEIDHLADISRPRFISYDPDLFIYPDSSLFNLEYEKKEEIQYQFETINQDIEKNLRKAVEMVERGGLMYVDGSKHNYILDLSRVANKFGCDLSTFQGFVRREYPDWYSNPTNAIEHTFRKRANENGIFNKSQVKEIKVGVNRLIESEESEEDFLTKLKGWEADWAKPEPKPIPVVTCNGGIVSTPGNITLISGHSKVGKSGAVTAIKAGSMPLTGIKIDTLGFDVVPNKEGKLFLSIDTEQSRYNFDKNFRDSVSRSGQASSPEWFKSLWLKNESTKKLIDYTWKALDYYSKIYGGVYHVVIDGIGDYVSNSNDLEESSQMVKEFTQMAEHYNCPLTTMLHLNPGSDKQRGHLGTFLQHKSETVIKITKQGLISTIEFQLQRNAGDSPNINFEYNKKKGYHTFLSYSDANGISQDDKLEEIMQRALSMYKELPTNELIAKIAEDELIPATRARAMIRKARNQGLILQRTNGHYSLESNYTPF